MLEEKLIEVIRRWSKICEFSQDRDDFGGIRMSEFGFDDFDNWEILMDIEEVTDVLLPDFFIENNSELTVKEFVDLVMLEVL